MTKIMQSLCIATLLALCLSAAPAQATTFRTFVSAHGSDANACTLPSPCRTFAAALAQTSAGGIIDVLDPAGYGALTITKSITIIGRDWASILVTSGNAITISANPGDVVNLRGLIIDGAEAFEQAARALTAVITHAEVKPQVEESHRFLKVTVSATPGSAGAKGRRQVRSGRTSVLGLGLAAC